MVREKKLSISDMTMPQFQEELTSHGIPKYRAQQVFQWIYEKGCNDFFRMTNLSRRLQEELAARYSIIPLTIRSKQMSKDGTIKLLYQLDDGETVESVLMIYGDKKNPDRITVCVSTQVGCKMNCAFCATGLDGFIRNLTVGEIAGQVLGFQQLLKEENSQLRVTNVVYMGMGEPLLNFQNVVESMRHLHDQHKFNISYRRISVSTCGIVPQILRLANEQLPVVLAISLHATTNHVRDKLVPINKNFPLEELLDACRQYVKITGRKVTFEYIMLANINDSMADADRLAKLTKNLLVNINIIPFNEVNETGYKRSKREQVAAFAQHLTKHGVEVVVREEKGGDILAACGQLRQLQHK